MILATIVKVEPSTNIGLISGTIAKRLTIAANTFENISAIVRIKGAPRIYNTVVLISGGTGNEFWEQETGGLDLITSLLGNGYRVCQICFQEGWWFSGCSLRDAASRVEIVLQYLKGQFGNVPFILVGQSGGSGAIGYCVTERTAGFPSRIVLCSGPPMTRLDVACVTEIPLWWQEESEILLTEVGLNTDLTFGPGTFGCMAVANRSTEILRVDSILYPHYNINTTIEYRCIVGDKDTTAAVPFALLFISKCIAANSQTYVVDAPHLITSTLEGRNKIIECIKN